MHMRLREERGGGENLNLNLFLFYNCYKLGPMPLFNWPLNINNRLITEEHSSNY